MLSDLTLLAWIRLAAVCLYALGPGYLVYVLLASHKATRRFQDDLALVFAGTVAVLAVLAALFSLAGLHFSQGLILAGILACWIPALAIDRPWKYLSKFSFRFSDLLFWIAVMVTFAVYLWYVRHLPGGPGSDSYHHTLIIQMILDQGGLPANYHPYAPIATFTYHFGYHSLMALIASLSGLTPRLVVVFSIPLLMAFISLSIGSLTNRLFKNPWAGVVAAALAGLGWLFPGYMLSWGRYPQLLALGILAVLTGLLADWFQEGCPTRRAALVGLLAAGLFLTHYRITMFAIPGTLVILVGFLVKERFHGTAIKKILPGVVLSLGLALLLAAPWLLHLVASSSQGFSVARGAASAIYYDIRRLGPEALGFPTNRLILAACGLGVLWAFIQRESGALLMVAWAGLLLVISQPRLSGETLDFITVIVSLFLPAIPVLAWMLIDLIGLVKLKTWITGLAACALVIPVCTINVRTQAGYFQPERVYITAGDLQAFTWIRAHTPEDALFLVNTFNFDFLSTYIIGIDGGYWLPMLAGRSSVVPPMNYSQERWDDPTYLERLVGLHDLHGQLTTPEAMALLEKDGVSYIYIGEHGGIIDPNVLETSACFEPVYQEGRVFIFHFLGSACVSP